MSQHVFVLMPFGVKGDVDFDRIYEELVRPALFDVGLEPFRGDEKVLPGEIRADMFQELLMADVVVADLSIDNPNVWYELGVRHGLRAHGIVQIRHKKRKIPFDTCVDWTFYYHVFDKGPDPNHLEKDKKALGEIALKTLQSKKKRASSPVYRYLPNLQEPDWKSLRVKNADGYWRKHDDWAHFIAIARKKNKPGDILVLAGEAPSYSLRLEGYRTAGNALLRLRQFSFSLEQYEKALEIHPGDLESAQKKGLVLGRLGKSVEAEEWLKKLLEKHREDGETWALLGRIEKVKWINLWRSNTKNPTQMLVDAADEGDQLIEAFQTYRKGFLLQPKDYDAGINTLALGHVLQDLNIKNTYEKELKAIEGGVRWAVNSALAKESPRSKNFWARVTWAELMLFVSEGKEIEEAYQHAVAAAGADWLALESACEPLKILQDLTIRSSQVDVALKILERAIVRLKKSNGNLTPRNVFLFSGHMIDAPGRVTSRFPPNQEAVAEKAIVTKLSELDANAEDLAFCGGACGGDLLFAEACLKRNVRVQIHLPFEEPKFLQESVNFAGENWRKRFLRVKNNKNTTLLIMPDELGPLPPKTNPHERNNLWLLYSALSRGEQRVSFLCLWDRQGGDGLGGTRHMHDSVANRSGNVHVLDTNALFRNS